VTTLTIIGLDIAKTSFQIHGVAAYGRTTLRKTLRRGKVLEFFANLPACVIGMEACGGAHYWARELTKLGHEVRLMPPQYVKPYVKTNKHDAANAEGCCEAVQRPGMRFVPVKSERQQSLLMLHRIRDRLVAERTGTINAIRGHMAEFGIVAARRGLGMKELLAIISVSTTGACRRWPESFWCFRSSTCGRSRRGSLTSTDACSTRRATTRPPGG
jgi:transposase